MNQFQMVLEKEGMMGVARYLEAILQTEKEIKEELQDIKKAIKAKKGE